MIYTFWDGLLISKFKAVEKGLEYNLIKRGLLEGRSLDKQILVYKNFLDIIKDRKLNNKPIRRSDHNFSLYCIMALIKLKVIEEEDDPLNGLYYPPKRKRS